MTTTSTRRQLHTPPLRVRLSALLLLGLPLAASATADAPVAGANRQLIDQRSLVEVQRAAEMLAQQQSGIAEYSRLISSNAMQLAMADRQLAEGQRLSDAERAELDAARERLEKARQEMQEASREVAELARKASAEALEMQLHHPAFSRTGIGVVLGPDEQAGVAVVAITP